MKPVNAHPRALLRPLQWAACALALLCLLSSCSTQKRLATLDREVSGLLAEAQRKQFGEGQAPESFSIDGYAPWQPPTAQTDGAKAKCRVNLRQALEIAAQHSRSYQTAKETLYTTALSLRSAQHGWEWNPTNNLSALLGIEQEPNSSYFRTNTSVGFTKRLLSGGRLTGSLAATTLRYFTGDHRVSIQTLANLTVTQPLLRGYGPLVAREGLTQAERNLIYALRSFVRTREELLITIAERYYAVLNAEADLRIGEQSYAGLKYSRDRSEAMGEGGRVTQIDVDQARQRVLTSESNLVTYREAIQTAKDSLKVALAVPLDVELEVDPQDMAVMTTMKLPRPSISLEEAIALALRQRLDFATTCDRLEDYRRALGIAEDNMRAKLDVSASASAASRSARGLHAPRLHGADFSVGLEADLPFDRLDETVALRRAQIALAKHQRDIDETRESIIQSLRNTWNNLATYEKKVEIQKISIALAEKRVENTRMLFEDGRIAIREYLDAQDDLSNAKNAFTQQLVSHRMCWLRLLYQLDELKVDPATFWTERLAVKQEG